MAPPTAHSNQAQSRHQSDAESKPSSSSRSYQFWRKHRRAHTTSTAIPNISLSLAPISAPIPISSQPLIAPKRLHDRQPLSLEKIEVNSHTEEVPIVFLSPVRPTQHKYSLFPLTVQTHRPPHEPTRSAPTTPWAVSPRTIVPPPPLPSPDLSKRLPILPLIAATAPCEAIGPAPRIPLPPPPHSPSRTKRVEALRPSVSVRAEQAKRPLLHARSSSAPYLEVPFRLEPPPKSPLRERALLPQFTMPIRQVRAGSVPQMGTSTGSLQPPVRAAPRKPVPLVSVERVAGGRRPSQVELTADDLPPPLKSLARTSLYPAALLSPRLPPLPFTPTNNASTPPPSPSSAAPAVMTSLLSEVLTIMNTIMSTQQDAQHDSDQQAQILAELTELVIIMQSEAEDLLNLADLVEEYVEEVDVAEQVAEVEDWAEDLDLGYYGSPSQSSSPTTQKRRGHGREDSAVSLNTDDGIAFHAGEMRESIRCEETVVLKPVAMGDEIGSAPIVKAPMPRRLQAKKSLSAFRDSGVSLFTSTSKGSVKGKRGEKKTTWM